MDFAVRSTDPGRRDGGKQAVVNGAITVNLIGTRLRMDG